MGMQCSLHNVQNHIKYVKNEQYYLSKTLSKKLNTSAAFWL